MPDKKISRRTFLKVTSVAGTGMLVGCSFQSNPLVSSPDVKSEELGLFVRISKDNNITIISPTSEIGQGTHTAHAMIIAEELDAEWEKIKVVTTNKIRSEYYTSSSVSTGGNRGIRLWWDRLAEIGAGTRELLIQAGAQKMKVPVRECIAKKGFIHHQSSNRKISFGLLAETASQLDPPRNPTLKSKNHYRFIGKPIQRLDIPSKVNGSAVYGTDIRLPGMLFAAVSQAHFFGGEVTNFDENAAKSVKGVIAVLPIPHGISVVADSSWHAQKGLEALNVQFEGGKKHNLGTKSIEALFSSSLEKMGKGKIQGEKTLDLEYEIQFLSHAAIEPMNCTASVKKNKCEVWGPFQMQSGALKKIKDTTGLNEDQIKVHSTYVGGGFGGRFRLWGEDFVEQAVLLSKKLGKPVQVFWSREEDIQHDYYHPTSKSRFQISLGSNGFPEQFENQQAAGSQWVQNSKFLKMIDINPMAYSSSAHSGLTSSLASLFAPKFEPHYDLKGVNFNHTTVDMEIPLGWLRSYMFQNTFYLESAIDESAHFANIDPFVYRMQLLRNNSRFRRALELVAEDANWGSHLTEGYGRGISIGNFQGGVCAQVAEVSVSKRGKLAIHKINCVIDVGEYVNPDTLIAQTEGCIIWGISIATKEQITFKDGRVQQSNYDDYKIAKMKDCPIINVRIIDSKFAPSGGDAGLPPTPPAITNAIYSATGKRIRKLPILKQELI